MTISAPNESQVRARIASIKDADDGWGAWADLEIEEGAELAGRSVRVFVPPPHVAAFRDRSQFEGSLTFRGAHGDGTYAVVHVKTTR